MDKRKIELIQAGTKLFARKGFHKTSVQDIATQAGISKGAFYLSFESKEEFIRETIQYVMTELNQKIDHVERLEANPKCLFKKQINILVSYVDHYKDFLMMLFQENISLGRQAEQLYQQMKRDSFYRLKKNICAIYGKRVQTSIVDAVIQVEGLLDSYLQWIIIDNISVDRDRISSFVLDRLDDLIVGMEQKNVEPLVSKEDITLTFHLLDIHRPDERKIKEILVKMKEAIYTLNLPKDEQSELIEVADMLQHEQQKVIIQGLLAHFHPYSSLHKYCKQLAELFNIDLLTYERKEGIDETGV